MFLLVLLFLLICWCSCSIQSVSYSDVAVISCCSSWYVHVSVPCCIFCSILMLLFSADGPVCVLLFLFHAVSVLFWYYCFWLMILFVCPCLCFFTILILPFLVNTLCVHAYGSVLFWYYCSWLVILFVCPCLCFYTVLIFLFLIDDPLYALAFLPINIMFIYWYSHFILLYLCWSGGAVQHLGCFKEKVNRYELQPELMAGELLELSNSMTVDQCANRWELAFDRLDPKA